MPDLFQLFAKEYAAYGYPVLFFGVLLENAGLPVPGETAVLIAGALAGPGGEGHFDIGLVIAVAFLAAVIGDNIGYWLGRELARPRLTQGRGFFVLTPARMQLVEAYFHRYGAWTIFVARFITGMRVFAAPAAGAAGMNWERFFVANAAGALLWATVISLLGYWFGQSWDLIHRWLGRSAWILLGVVVLGFIAWKILNRRRPLQADSTSGTAAP